jgi:hypothetical protein
MAAEAKTASLKRRGHCQKRQRDATLIAYFCRRAGSIKGFCVKGTGQEQRKLGLASAAPSSDPPADD